jgi:8-amino-7-oxononanoate synthase
VFEPTLDNRLREIVDDRAARQLLRELDARSTKQSVLVTVDRVDYRNFSSNDYLSLSTHPLVQQAAAKAIEVFGVGSGASPLLSGRTDSHAALEERVARFLGRPAALCFSSGYSANIGVINGIVRRTDVIFSDRLLHASLIDAVRLTGARARVYPHGDMLRLQRFLERYDDKERWIVTDGVFSMDGDIAPLQQLTSLARSFRANLIVDDAHGIGVIGANGKGSLELTGSDGDDVPVLLGTFGKAFGSAGAFVAGSKTLIQALVQVARSYVYSTALAPALAAAALASLDLIETDPSLRASLHANIALFRTKAIAAELPLLDSVTPIQPILIGDDAAALVIARELRAQGFYLRAIRPPTVPPGTSRLRICINAAHSAEQIESLVAALHSALLNHADVRDGRQRTR